ncbi:hypothetical protein IJT17_00520 [bacterium]|nr:hypothetical protein [bacterium]
MVSISPDNRYICGYTREVKRINNQPIGTTIMYILPIMGNGAIGQVRAYNLEGISRVEQACFTPDSRAVVFTTKAGATFIRLDIASGAMTTIMEHKKGQPGFRSYPEIIINSGREMIAQGYFYDANDFAGRNAIAVLDPYKTGISAFTLANEIQKAQFSVRQQNRVFTEIFPRKDIGFMTIHCDGHCLFYRWNAQKGVKCYDRSKELLGAWGGDSRLFYSTKRPDNTYDLCLFDGRTDIKTIITSGRSTPYTYLFLSADGRTAVFNDRDPRQGLTTIYYARESEGWKIHGIKGLSKHLASGAMRISDDGTKLLLHNSDGIRVIDIIGG